MKHELLPKGMILLPVHETRAPTEKELPVIKHMDKKLRARTLKFDWSCCMPGGIRTRSPLVWLIFAGRIDIDEMWCKFFRAQFITEGDNSWIARPAFHAKDSPSICLMPRPDQIDLQAAMEWAPVAEYDPIVKAEVGFLGRRPRVITFPPRRIVVH
jgi:hypothetical protein